MEEVLTKEQIETKAAEDAAKLAEKNFSQADLDRVVKDRLAKERIKVLKELGVEDTDNFKESFQTFKAAEEAKKTEFDKAKEAMGKHETEKAEWTSKAESYEYKIAALKLGIADDKLEDAVVLAKTRLAKNDKLDINGALTEVVTAFPGFGIMDESRPGIKIGETKPKPKGNEKTERKYPKF